MYEPVIHVHDSLVRRTSRAAEPEICRGSGSCYHESCYDSGADVHRRITHRRSSSAPHTMSG